MSDFEKLLDELETMAKAIPSDTGEDDTKIQAAADDDAGNGGDDDDAAAAEAAGGDDDDAMMGKSFTVTGPDGKPMEAIDGTAVVKALMGRVEKNEGVMQKALEGAVGLIKSQGTMIKSLQDQLAKLSNEGRGRKAVVTVVEKTDATLAKSEQPADGMPVQEFMAKALVAQAAGRITGNDVARAEAYLHKGLQVPADIVQKVIQ